MGSVIVELESVVLDDAGVVTLLVMLGEAGDWVTVLLDDVEGVVEVAVLLIVVFPMLLVVVLLLLVVLLLAVILLLGTSVVVLLTWPHVF